MFNSFDVMNDDVFRLVQQSVEMNSTTDDERLLEQLRITRDKELPPMHFLFRIFGKPCFPRGELVAVTGKAKSGKTLFNSLLMACCVNCEVLQVQRTPEEGDGSCPCQPVRCLWYDTEQSEQSTQDILKNRILRMIEGDNNFDIFNVRCLHYEERMRLFLMAVRKYRPALVVLDGVRDLLADINDGIRAQEVVEDLMKLAQETDCCLVCVLHQNKGAEDRNPRGWIGTELMNKAFEVYACEKLMPQRIFKVEQTLTRKYDIEQALYFEVGEDGLPKASPLPPPTGGGEQSRERLPELNSEYIVHEEDGNWQVDVRRLFSDAIGGRQQVTGAELRSEVCRLSNIRSWKFYNSLLEQAVNGEVIMKSYDHAAHVIYALRPQAPVQTELYQDDGEPF